MVAYVMSDIHGCYEEFLIIFEKLDFQMKIACIRLEDEKI